MHINRIDLNLLVVFDTIYAEASITRASRRLNLSQPAISHALGRLREMVEDPLFTRHGRLMTPTPLARRMIEPIRQSLQGIEATLTKGDRFAPASAVKHFTVGMREALETALLGKLMRSIAERAPRVTISTVQDRAPRTRARTLGRDDRCGDRCPIAVAGRDQAGAASHRMADGRGSPASPEGRPQAHAPHLFEPGAHRGLVAAPRLERGRLRAGSAEFAPPHSFAMPESFGGVPGGQRNRPDLDDAATPRWHPQRAIRQSAGGVSAQSAGVRHLPLLARQRGWRSGQRLAPPTANQCVAAIACRTLRGRRASILRRFWVLEAQQDAANMQSSRLIER